MKILGWLIVFGIVIYLFSKGKFSAMVSAGNPNLPPPQMATPEYGPQGPNDGSNNYIGSGHTILPILHSIGPDQNPISRGFRYTTGTYAGAVQGTQVY